MCRLKRPSAAGKPIYARGHQKSRVRTQPLLLTMFSFILEITLVASDMDCQPLLWVGWRAQTH